MLTQSDMMEYQPVSDSANLPVTEALAQENHYITYPCLRGKSVFITGGASGIGAELVRAFTMQHAKVGFIDIDENAADQLIGDLTAQQSATPWFRANNVANVDDMRSSIHAFAALNDGVDILINNVANDHRFTTSEMSENDWTQCMQVNLNSAFFAAQTVQPYMQSKQAGAIINFSSINAFIAPPNMVGYNTAKAGLLGMTKSLANELGADNIRVNALLPGWVATDKQLNSWLTEEEEAQWLAQMALKKRLYPHHVAKLALFLASDESDMITGQGIAVDGGRHA